MTLKANVSISEKDFGRSAINNSPCRKRPAHNILKRSDGALPCMINVSSVE
jgi:hypothetical protein